jgi:uncharacterized membrane protein
VAAAVVGVAVFVYRRPLAPLSRAQRATLVALRAAALLLPLLFILRPIVMRTPAAAGDIVVPILIDHSRSMGIRDEGQDTRQARAIAAVTGTLVAGISPHFKPEFYVVGGECRSGSGMASCSVAPDLLGRLPAPSANQSDLTGAIGDVRDLYRGRQIAGIVLVSDGADTGHDSAHAGAAIVDPSIPVFTLGVGSAAGVADREVVGIAAGDPRLDQASIDLHVSVASRGFGRTPFDVRLSANGRPLETRRVTPVADGAPIDVTFTAVPDATTPTVYTAEIAPQPGEQVPENNMRSVLVSPPGRKRRVLVLEGAPGFEHSFLTRALSEDRGLEIDVVVRKGKNDAGQDTFSVQAPANRASLLASGFPARREDLFSYDAIALANVPGDFLTRAQLSAASDFVAIRGGGLLVLGGLSFAEHGLIGTPLEPVLPVELGDRRGGLVRTSFGADLGGPRDTVVLTPEGESHPIMRIGSSVEDTRKKWKDLPPLAGSAPLGGPRAGATVLAVTSVAGGAVYPVVAVQQYGQGRSMVFGGEAAWRWRMMQPLTDRSYELFWRQAVRWLAGPAPDPVAVVGPDAAQADASQPGDTLNIDALVRDTAFLPVPDAAIAATVAGPDGSAAPAAFRRDGGADGRFTASIRAGRKGVYHVQLDATRNGARVGAAERWFYVGGSDRELADPRLNEAALKRIARATGGRYAPVADAAQVASWLSASAPKAADLEPHDLWHEPWALAIVVALLGAEWSLRRRWGLR